MKIGKKIFKKFNSLDFFQKIFYINIIIMFAFVCLFGVVQYFSVKNLVVEQHKYSVSHNHEQTCSLITSLITDYSTAINMLENEKIVDEFIKIHSFDQTNTQDIVDEHKRYQEFNSTVESILSNMDINNYSIYTSDGYVYANDSRYVFTNNDMKNTRWYKYMADTQSRIMYFDSSYFTKTEDVENDYIYCVGLVYSDEDFGDYAGAIRLGIAKSKIEAIMQESVVIPDCSSAIYSSRGDLVTNIGAYDDKLQDAYKNVYDGTEEGLMHFSDGGKSYIAAKKSILLTDWTLIDILPLSGMLSTYYSFTWKLLFVMVIIFMLILFILHLVFVSYTKRLTKLVDTMSMYRYGELNLIEENDIHDDIGRCIDAYNLMAANIQQMYEQQREASEKLNAYNMQIMYERVNPHFLYNTLEIINRMATERGIDCISESVQKLADYYRLSLNNTKETLTLEQEMQHCELYVDICNQRFYKNISFFCEIPDDFMDIEVPKMILQPVVENSIRHGFVPKKETGDNEIVVAAYKRGEYVDIEITDNGMGIEVNKLMQLKNMEIGSGGIGLKSTNERVKLYFGEDCGVSVTSEPGEFTTVIIRIKEKG